MHFNLFSALLAISSFFSLIHTYAITGATGGVDTSTGQRPSRQEFRSFAVSGAAFDLYILALQQSTQDNQSALLSYYQIAGIHGRPYIPWDGVDGRYDAGYCTHSSILFPGWHRPYLALFEQILWNNAQNIASTYPDPSRGRYQSAAQSLRIPYWDWATNATMPDQMNEPMISVNTPNGIRNINNPLYSYTFHPLPSESEFPLSDGDVARYRQTVRYPDAQGKSQPELSNMQLQANADGIRSGVYNLISSQSEYAPFSNTAFVDERGDTYDSIENIHNGIHLFVGNGGHMGVVPYSGFDPIFWLHHTNVDRLIAIWQAIYPDSWIDTAQVTGGGTFTDAPGSSEDQNTPLTPFHSSDSSTLYTSVTARSTRSFGYTYPETIDSGLSTTDVSNNARAALNRLYGSGSTSAARLKHKRSHLPLLTRSSTTNDTTAPYPKNITTPLTPANITTNSTTNSTYTTVNSTTYYDYAINIHVLKSALNASFFIHFYLGDPNCPDNLLSFATNLVGSYANFFHHSSLTVPNTSPTTPITRRAIARRAPTSALADGGGTVTYGQVPLTHALLSSSSSNSYGAEKSYAATTAHLSSRLTPGEVVPLLKKELQWRVQLTNDSAVPADCPELESAGLGIYVVGRIVEYPGDGECEFPEYGVWVPYGEVTQGKAGGYEI